MMTSGTITNSFVSPFISYIFHFQGRLAVVEEDLAVGVVAEGLRDRNLEAALGAEKVAVRNKNHTLSPSCHYMCWPRSKITMRSLTERTFPKNRHTDFSWTARKEFSVRGVRHPLRQILTGVENGRGRFQGFIHDLCTEKYLIR